MPSAARRAALRRFLLLVAVVAVVLGVRAPVRHAATAPATPAPAGQVGGAARAVLLAAAVEGLPPAPAFFQLLRWTYAPGAERAPFVVPGPTLLVVEAGTLTVDVGGMARLTRAAPGGTPAAEEVVGAPTATLRLGPGDRLALPAEATRAFRNEGTEPAVFLAVRIFPGAPEVSPLPEGVRLDRLGSGAVTAWPGEPVAVEVARATLAPAQALPPQEPPGPTLVFVEAGVLGLAVAGAPAEIERRPVATATAAVGPPVAGDPEDLLPPGFAVFAEPGSTLTLRNAADEPLVLLVVGFASAPPAAPADGARPGDGAPRA